MKTRPLSDKIEGPLVIEYEPFRDERGFFVLSFNFEQIESLGINPKFSQDNHSYSEPNVLRGLHFQFDPAQAKIIWVPYGKIFDVVVDVRPQSPTFLKHASIELSSENVGQTLYVPEGFAHGFCVLGDKPVHTVYKMSQPYNPKGESGLLWNDSDLDIKWPIKNPLISERDKNLLSANELKIKLKV